ncbi:trifunctional transcriptional activator/DNA repair protein Ada/methylated-DNA--[protein]-cysteine S-methyltransferase [Pelagibacterium flavum]|uniref:Trifunctional transcriptional activator/DNA repair protein Ada/methylated-DNA--[protein]-cysteine S-methyltransferase n=1 Tax=Pelagibacterium flavum TaxID=2984530 RepID=A0ABY6IQ05_9HYPH|nr:trifunctional transcriptional activator/DNA repair protein Ada/methylated-DNA--[protein]-cysteine S-methyltransferase [Pelagibacterium sp. YIM 151497]UYQ72688.1 trifunctional transcriptional activator/DNA repair protein Ada/methylated-DNA--[protein]-cysteine S-methyltransferase [Pelagibacterium sp. YIM 151497]|tara:strand:- start:1386 stop:2492 length:1107 start_codon:yes stop_codon:yes gene_type:complete
MLFDLPDHETLYRALIERDARFDGQAFVCVSSTGIFCRLTCPARKPLSENCIFRASIGECIEAGFRPCKRCHPMQAAAADDPVVKGLLEALDGRPERRWTERHVVEMGYDLSTVRRSFKRHFGMTFLEIARQRRLREGFETLAEGGKVVTAQHEAGFDSPSAFRAAFARILGCAPGDLSRDGLLRASWIATPLGDMIAVASSTHLHLLEFIDRKALPGELKRLRAAAKGSIGLGRTGPIEQVAAELGDFFAGRSARFETPLHQEGSAFTRKVWAALRAIPAGQTRSYGQIAEAIGRPSAVRAVARANGANTIALVVPCHRVIGADGALTGYGGGLWRKQRLLEIERQYRAERRDAERESGAKAPHLSV